MEAVLAVQNDDAGMPWMDSTASPSPCSHEAPDPSRREGPPSRSMRGDDLLRTQRIAGSVADIAQVCSRGECGVSPDVDDGPGWINSEDDDVWPGRHGLGSNTPALRPFAGGADVRSGGAARESETAADEATDGQQSCTAWNGASSAG